jgi:UTP--glucose-1-phosphate uridylyltransferase
MSGDSHEYIREADISPLQSVKRISSADAFASERSQQVDLLNKTLIIKLNGGLGTTMGLNKAKSLLQVKDDLTFLDIIIRQVLMLREKYNAIVPLLLMNSYNTASDTNEYIGRNYPELDNYGLPLVFLQHRQPKLLGKTLEPVVFPEESNLEWCPPGHGDFYSAIFGTGVLKQYIDAGYKYAFVSNSDNIGATYNFEIGHYFESTSATIMLELADKTASDVKGGHIVKKGDTYVLREVAQIHLDDLESAFDISVHPYFNTNSLWINLHQLYLELSKKNGVLDLPIIVNKKHVRAHDKTTPKIIQLETAIGSAVSCFNHVAFIQVPRTRFLPVKTLEDFEIVASEEYVLDENYNILKK